METTTYPADERRVLILASYCGEDDAACTDNRPCSECLAMCNVAIARGTLEVLGGLDYVAEVEARGWRSPDWKNAGCYVSPYPSKIFERYDNTTGDYVKTRQHLFPQASGIPARCNPVACRECERERTWHDHGEPK